MGILDAYNISLSLKKKSVNIYLWIDEFGFHLNKSVHPYFFQSWRKFTFIIHIPKQLC